MFGYDTVAELMQKILSTVADFLVYAGKPSTGFTTIFGTLLSPAYSSVCSLDPGLLLSEEPWRRDLLPGGECNECLQPNVESDRVLTGERRFRYFRVADKRNVPLSTGSRFDRGRLDRSFYLPVQNEGDRSNLWNHEEVSIQPHSLRESKRVGFRMPGFPTGPSGPAFALVLESAFQIFEHLLKRLSHGLIEERRLFRLLEFG